MPAIPDRPRAPLSEYWNKRDFEATPEPAPSAGAASPGDRRLAFVVQKHWARRLHYDFRLELDGVLRSWAVPKGPSFDPAEKRIAIHVEDHPVEYAGFEGTIPPGQYGAGTVLVWDRGSWEPVGDPREGMKAGKLVFRLHGEKLAGLWELVRIAKPGDKQDPWMLFKKRDEWAQPLAQYDVIKALPDSVIAKPLGLAEARERKGLQRSTDADPDIDLDLAEPAPLPASIEPQRATLAACLPTGGDWLPETKFDGYRMLARIDKGRARLFTSGGQDWTKKLRHIADEVRQLPVLTAWLDGETVVLKDGIPDFNALQNAIDGPCNEQIVYFVFDLMYLDGVDLRRVPLRARRARLAQLLDDAPGERIRFSEDFDAPPAQLFKAACELGLEGLMLKQRDAPYVSGRTQTWLKAKCRLRQEFVICGFTNRSAAFDEVGSLLLGYHANGKLRAAGSVGTGWDAKTARELRTRLSAIEVPAAPLDAPAGARRSTGRETGTAGSTHWVKPELVAEVAFAEWTPNGHVRHASFKGLRADKPAADITREAGRTVAPSAAVTVTHPERVIDTTTGLTKLDLVRYYESVAPWMMPHLKDRPVAMVRAPDGVEGEQFFQKHAETTGMPGLTQHDPKLWPGHAALLTVDTPEALVAAAQMNVVEFHTWNSTVRRLTTPDRVIFDLDPGEGLPWQQLREAALLVQALLTELGLKAWLKTSGGKGLHIVVPLTPKLAYDAVKQFSRAFVRHLANTIPERFSATSGPSHRVGKVFVDYLRNGMGQTTAAAFTARARPGMGVSMPVSWEQLGALKSGAQWTALTAREYLSFQTDDPWADYWSTGQSLAPAIKRLQ